MIHKYADIIQNHVSKKKKSNNSIKVTDIFTNQYWKIIIISAHSICIRSKTRHINSAETIFYTAKQAQRRFPPIKTANRNAHKSTDENTNQNLNNIKKKKHQRSPDRRTTLYGHEKRAAASGVAQTSEFAKRKGASATRSAQMRKYMYMYTEMGECRWQKAGLIENCCCGERYKSTNDRSDRALKNTMTVMARTRLCSCFNVGLCIKLYIKF